jgi:hypothetical protein
MAEGDTITRPLGSDGVPMIEGDPTEPQGPEDAAGQGVKRGDYSDRGDGRVHREYGRDADGDLEIRDQNAAMNSTPGVPDAGEKGGVDSYDASTDEGGAYDSVDESEVQTITVSATSFTLTYDGETTSSLTTASTNGAEVQAALEALSNVSPGDVTVTGADGGPYVATFDPELGDVPAITGVGTGGAATVTVVETNKGS